jgi:ERCC4-type nuclease
MYLLIDYREQDFIDKLSSFCIIENEIVKAIKINGEEISIKITNLPIADFIITEDIHDNTTIKLAIERKSINDLYSSIIDGRFREQKSRLLDSLGDPNKICYLIEGFSSKLITVKKINMIRGSIVNLIFKHQYPVITTQDKLDTFNHILLLYKKHKNGEFSNNLDKNNKIDHTSMIDSKTYSGSIKLRRKCENIEDSKILHQLCLIPGISPTIANAIILWLRNKGTLPSNDVVDKGTLPSNDVVDKGTLQMTNSSVRQGTVCIKTIIDLYKEDDCNPELLFTDIIISSTEKRVRKVGRALSKKIYQYFCT